MANGTLPWWRRFAAWGIDLRSRTASDLLAAARLKIAFWYAFIGLIILAVGGYLVYAYIIFIIGDIIRIIQALIETRAAVNQDVATTIITQSIDSDLVKMSIAVGIWIIFTMVLSAYVLAEIILWPIRRAVERQRRFIANVSHELRTPLSVMRTNAEVALMNTDGGPSRDELAATIQSNLEEVDRMMKITQFLMNFSNSELRLDAAQLTFVDLVKPAQAAVKQMEMLATEHHIALHFATDQPVVRVRGNATALEEMITNLIKNAITYTPAGGKVSVNLHKRSAASRAGDIMLTVTDTGVGIPKDDLPNIFEAFYRGRNVGRKGKGTSSGLGLAIVKEIAAMHGATVSARSEMGKGTSMSVYFPSFS